MMDSLEKEKANWKIIMAFLIGILFYAIFGGTGTQKCDSNNGTNINIEQELKQIKETLELIRS